MKKRNPVLGVVGVLVLAAVSFFVLRLNAAKAEITIGGTAYEMCTLSVREFMQEGYSLATMTTTERSIYTYDYSSAMLEAKSYYNTGVPMRLEDGSGAPISIWVYNPTPEEVGIRDGKINSISCNIPELLSSGVSVSIAGLELNGQSKAELTGFMDGTLKGYTFSENEEVNAVSYTKGSVSYTFVFDGSDILEKGIARNSV